MCMSDTERARIESCPQARIDGRVNDFWGPVGIAMTRAVGDAIILRAGVLPWPIVDRYEYRQWKQESNTTSAPARTGCSTS